MPCLLRGFALKPWMSFECFAHGCPAFCGDGGEGFTRCSLGVVDAVMDVPSAEPTLHSWATARLLMFYHPFDVQWMWLARSKFFCFFVREEDCSFLVISLSVCGKRLILTSSSESVFSLFFFGKSLYIIGLTSDETWDGIRLCSPLWACGFLRGKVFPASLEPPTGVGPARPPAPRLCWVSAPSPAPFAWLLVSRWDSHEVIIQAALPVGFSLAVVLSLRAYFLRLSGDAEHGTSGAVRAPRRTSADACPSVSLSSLGGSQFYFFSGVSFLCLFW